MSFVLVHTNYNSMYRLMTRPRRQILWVPLWPTPGLGGGQSAVPHPFTDVFFSLSYVTALHTNGSSPRQTTHGTGSAINATISL